MRLPEQTLEKDRLDPRVWRIVSVAVLGSFLSQLDATVVNVSLSSLATELHSSLTVIQWVTSGYLLALVLMLPLNGWLVERIGAKRLYLVSFSGFTLASALCALSWSAGSLIGFRLLQGVSGGLMAPMTQLMLVRVAGKHLVRVVGYAAVPILLGPILGPVMLEPFSSTRPGIGSSSLTCRSVPWRLYSLSCFCLMMTTQKGLREAST
jgi:MFS family permease